MIDPDQILAKLDAISADLDIINRKLSRMPTKRECLAFVIGFVTCTTFVLLLAIHLGHLA